MSARLVATAAIAAAASLLVATSAPAQRAPTTSAEVKVLEAVGTKDEQPAMQAMIARIKTRLSTDATLVKRYDEAIAKRDLTTAGAVIAEAAGVKPDQVVLVQPAKLGLAGPRPTMFYLASMPTYNPFHIIIAYKGGAACIGFGGDAGRKECVDALRKLGYQVS